MNRLFRGPERKDPQTGQKYRKSGLARKIFFGAALGAGTILTGGGLAGALLIVEAGGFVKNTTPEVFDRRRQQLTTRGVVRRSRKEAEGDE